MGDDPDCDPRGPFFSGRGPPLVQCRDKYYKMGGNMYKCWGEVAPASVVSISVELRGEIIH